MKAIVIGAGILGASTAYQLAKRGVDVTLVDRGAPGDAASAASFAWLNSNGKEPREYHDLSVMSIAEWAALARELPSARWLHNVGNVLVADSGADAEQLALKVERLHAYGYAAIPLTPAELSRIDPIIRVRETYDLAVLFPQEGHISIPLLIHELLGAAKGLGMTVMSWVGVVDLIKRGNRVRGVVLENGDRLESDTVILAAGAGVGTVLASQGVDLPTKGKPGVAVTTSPGSSDLRTMLHLPGISIRPDADGRLVMRSATSDAEIDLDTWTLPDVAISKLIARAADALTDLDAASVRGERVRIASRPYPSDGLPLVGNWDDLPGLYVMTMHSGVTLGAIISRLAAEEITRGSQNALLEKFRPARVLAAVEDDVVDFDPHTVEAENRGTSS